MTPSALTAAVTIAEANSPYLKGLLRRRAATLTEIETHGFDAALAAAMVLDDTVPVEIGLRSAKADVALITALADLSGEWPLERVTEALSNFADLALNAAIAAALAERGAPNAGFVAIALGKLGSHELNYSSDVDLILLYDSVPLRPREDPAEAAVRIARRIVAIMQDRTADGYVFRVDLRLRPSSEITPIAMPVAAAENYYQSDAETWERTAFIRARACAGDIALGQRFLAAIRPFVWRRSLDYTAIRDIKAVSLRIRDHFESGQAVGPRFDLKRGRGGIREIEFFTQIHQLVWGGRDVALQAPATLDALGALTAAGRIDADDNATLGDAYRWLRTLEHRLQMIGDEQTHSIPATLGQRQAWARLSSFAGPQELMRQLRMVTAQVARRYDRLIADADIYTPQIPADPSGWCKRNKVAPAFVPLIAKWRSGRYRALRSDDAKRAFEALLPELLKALAMAADPAHAASRLDTFVADLPAGVQFFALMAANPKLLPLLGRVLGIAPVLADSLARRPALFDALLARDSFAPLPGIAALSAELTAAVGAGTFEQRLDRTRLWTADRRFQLGAQLIERRDPLGIGADLSDVADAAVVTLADAVVTEFAESHGTVPGCRLVVLGLGRYGGRALTHASDLDLVYLFTGDHAPESTGAKPLAATVWFQRVAARLTAALSVPTAAGALYEVDTRLRPSGAKGLLAVTVASFARYQSTEAETWEHMALCRARIVAGAAADFADVETVIAAILDRPRDPTTLRRDVLSMRRDISAAKPGGGTWDVKLGAGGLVDLEFIVHFLQLRDRIAVTPDLRAALVALVAAGRVPDDLIAAHDTLTRVLALLRLVVTGALPKRFPQPVEALLAGAAGATDFPAAEAALGLAKAAVRAAWSDIFNLRGD
ncbi:bifunctional [glutamine synthetase] adenylyltransferase/[glutamine synthetase]-adenylyl-L-tyrosine phosphorylase [Polymorphobacter sp. PAMC 29334]|uniref:bifunctional [glutamine synthetase] adenylyltransferase/[glutamine synthetase]-adenylyl-L-tyrosine phosphorylase n=1 Tax=Polymorphobacter sp. PAMC 29334 TaxID=2862331 RepID=UPI001C73E669|nr:bifunctional [glutamine synthetase] adenylyltransferase/[glutamine synthetase]-adenylyl-L-tyrosine phosphorylase [Polymorphobacter sp. PAMC 29334]QYE34969.1 bifunctional [glutamine synthetase] adenylyltransferase/[glutamine synthetase]-adenylyl-L-tyrosine phosphorylase [Polymorphobacter sp. PAMC 29334]